MITIPRLEDPVDEIFIQRVFSARPTMPVSRYSFASALASLCDVNENGKNRERRRKKIFRQAPVWKTCRVRRPNYYHGGTEVAVVASSSSLRTASRPIWKRFRNFYLMACLGPGGIWGDMQLMMKGCGSLADVSRDGD